MYALATVLEESTFVATKLTAPAGLAGVFMVADKPSGETTTLVASAPPKLKVAGRLSLPRRYLPVTVTGVPPVIIPRSGIIKSTLGARTSGV